jgi:hypothetical protein
MRVVHWAAVIPNYAYVLIDAALCIEASVGVRLTAPQSTL